MILKLLIKLCEISPRFRKLVWHRWYQYLAGYKIESWRFMNYGYVEAADHASPLRLDPVDEPDRLAIQLYHFAIGDIDLQGREVLEVGCGRGGGAEFVSNYHQPVSMTALDYSQKAIRYCQKHRQRRSLKFVHGSAESLPFEDEQFDAVINIESSHCYRSMPAFLDQVRRVLRPGGYFCFADFRQASLLEMLDQQLNRSGMQVVVKSDITENVLASMQQDNQRKLQLIERWAGKRLHETLRQFAGVEGSEINEGFRHRKLVYMHYQLQKPNGPVSTPQ